MDQNKKVCNCMNVTVQMIRDAIQSGASNLEEVQEKTKAGKACGVCIDDVGRVVDEILKEENNK